jgi:hypothetical protein
VSNHITLLFIADIVGKPGLQVVQTYLPILKKQYKVDMCIANGENGYNGKGLTEKIAKLYFDNGIDVITGGNHIWQNAGYRRYLDESDRVLRPLNYPHQAPGKGSTLFKIRDNLSVGVLNVQGRTFMYPIDCPFRTTEEEIDRLKQSTRIIFVDFHAEATAEKSAFGWYFDGKVSAIVGTHTHVQTADERILPYGTAYISDAGMTGPHDSVIGMDIQIAIKRFITQVPERYRLAVGNDRFCGVVIKVDAHTGQAKKITRINLP